MHAGNFGEITSCVISPGRKLSQTINPSSQFITIHDDSFISFLFFSPSLLLPSCALRFLPSAVWVFVFLIAVISMRVAYNP